MDKKYKLICYAKIGSESELEVLNLKEAEKEKENLELMQPDNIYKIEEI